MKLKLQSDFLKSIIGFLIVLFGLQFHVLLGYYHSLDILGSEELMVLFMILPDPITLLSTTWHSENQQNMQDYQTSKQISTSIGEFYAQIKNSAKKIIIFLQTTDIHMQQMPSMNRDIVKAGLCSRLHGSLFVEVSSSVDRAF